MIHELNEQIAEVRREIQIRERVYPHKYDAKGWGSEKELNYRLDCMRSALRTLETLKRYRPDVHAAIEAAKARAAKEQATA